MQRCVRGDNEDEVEVAREAPSAVPILHTHGGADDSEHALELSLVPSASYSPPSCRKGAEQGEVVAAAWGIAEANAACPKSADLHALIPADWFCDWCLYARFDPRPFMGQLGPHVAKTLSPLIDFLDSASEQKSLEEDDPAFSDAKPPGPLDVSMLVDKEKLKKFPTIYCAECTDQNTFIPLKTGVHEDSDFVIVPGNVWVALEGMYPPVHAPIFRWERTDRHGQVSVEVHPVEAKVIVLPPRTRPSDDVLKSMDFYSESKFVVLRHATAASANRMSVSDFKVTLRSLLANDVPHLPNKSQMVVIDFFDFHPGEVLADDDHLECENGQFFLIYEDLGVLDQRQAVQAAATAAAAASAASAASSSTLRSNVPCQQAWNQKGQTDILQAAYGEDLTPEVNTLSPGNSPSPAQAFDVSPVTYNPPSSGNLWSNANNRSFDSNPSPYSSMSSFGTHYSYYAGPRVSSPPGVCGLSNLGNTCFMNSALQCLLHAPIFTNFILNADIEGLINEDNPIGCDGQLAREYSVLAQQLWSGEYSFVAPRKLKQIIGHFAPRFAGYRQHDSQELFAFLLDGLHEDLNQVVRKPYIVGSDSDGSDNDRDARIAWLSHLRRNRSMVVDLFQGQYRSTVTCPKCFKVSVTFDPFMYLSLPISADNMNIKLKITISVLRFPSEQELRSAEYRQGACPFSADILEQAALFDRFRKSYRLHPDAVLGDQRLSSPISCRVSMEVCMTDSAHSVWTRLCQRFPWMKYRPVRFLRLRDGIPNKYFSRGRTGSPGETLKAMLPEKDDVLLVHEDVPSSLQMVKYLSGEKSISEILDLPDSEDSIRSHPIENRFAPRFFFSKRGDDLRAIDRHDYHDAVHLHAMMQRPENERKCCAFSAQEDVKFSCHGNHSQIAVDSMSQLVKLLKFAVFRPQLNLAFHVYDLDVEKSTDESGRPRDSLFRRSDMPVIGNLPVLTLSIPDITTFQHVPGMISMVFLLSCSGDEIEPQLNHRRDIANSDEFKSACDDIEIVSDMLVDPVDTSQSFWTDSMTDEQYSPLIIGSVFVDFASKANFYAPDIGSIGDELAIRVKFHKERQYYVLSRSVHPRRPYPGHEEFFVIDWARTLSPREQNGSLQGICPFAEEISKLRKIERYGGKRPRISNSPMAKTLHDCLRLFVTPETLGQDDAWYCSDCKEHQQATKKMDIWRLPDVLVIHLKRFKHGAHRIRGKISSFVDFPVSDLDLSEYELNLDFERRPHSVPSTASSSACSSSGGGGGDVDNARDDMTGTAHASGRLPSQLSSEEIVEQAQTLSESKIDELAAQELARHEDKFSKRPDPVYDLFAVSNHMGSMGGGHYTAGAKVDSTGQWYLFDDSRVSEIEVEELVNEQAYMLFYVRRGIDAPPTTTQSGGGNDAESNGIGNGKIRTTHSTTALHAHGHKRQKQHKYF